MTQIELLNKIRQEIERLKKAQEVSEDKDYAQYEFDVACGYDMALNDILSFLSTLESEKPMEQDEDLNEEIKKFIDKYGYERGGDRLLIAIVARHFAEWQKEQDTRDMVMSDNRHFNKVYELGKKDMKEQMLKEAVECELYYDGDFLAIDLNMAELGYSERDKVRVIVIPNTDEK